MSNSSNWIANGSAHLHHQNRGPKVCDPRYLPYLHAWSCHEWAANYAACSNNTTVSTSKLALRAMPSIFLFSALFNHKHHPRTASFLRPSVDSLSIPVCSLGHSTSSSSSSSHFSDPKTPFFTRCLTNLP